MKLFTRPLSKMQANLMLICTTFFWGWCILLVKVAINAGLPVTLLHFMRGFVYSALCLLLYRKQIARIRRKDIRHGIIAGLLNFAYFFIQNLSLKYTVPSNCSFLTSMNVLLVPFIAWLFLKKRPTGKNFLCMGIYLIGVTLLTGVLEAGFSFNLGNALALLCAVCFATLITYLGSYAKGTDTGILVFFMAVTQAVMGGLLFFAMDFASFSPASINWGISILCVLGLAGVGSFLCTSLQTYAQKYTTPSSAVLLLSLESVFASTFSVLLGFEPLRAGLVIGGLIIMGAIYLSEAPLAMPHFARQRSGRRSGI